MKTLKRKIVLACCQNQHFKAEYPNYDNDADVSLRCQLNLDSSKYWDINTFLIHEVMK